MCSTSSLRRFFCGRARKARVWIFVVRVRVPISSMGMDPWWECDLCDAWLDLIGPRLVEPAEWERRRQIQHERKALLVLTGLWLGLIFAAGLIVVPQLLWALGGFVLSVLHWAVYLLLFLYAPIILMAIAMGTMIS